MITSADYETLRRILLENSGNSLGDGKEYLVDRRLAPVAASLGLENVAQLVNLLRISADRHVVKLVCAAMTTNESLFFRDGKPFQLLKDEILPRLMEQRRATRKIRIWSAAASTGQEAYSIAMTVREMPQLTGWNVEIVGTDYSPEVVERAKKGIFNHFEVQRGLPVTHLVKYFSQDEDGWQVNQQIRDSITFREGNLLEPFQHLGPFDLVYCRNVLIYFSQDGKRDVLERLARVMSDDGFLFLGSSETALGLTTNLSTVQWAGTTLFQRKDLPDAPGAVAAAGATRVSA